MAGAPLPGVIPSLAAHQPPPGCVWPARGRTQEGSLWATPAGAGGSEDTQEGQRPWRAPASPPQDPDSTPDAVSLWTTPADSPAPPSAPGPARDELRDPALAGTRPPQQPSQPGNGLSRSLHLRLPVSGLFATASPKRFLSLGRRPETRPGPQHPPPCTADAAGAARASLPTPAPAASAGVGGQPHLQNGRRRYGPRPHSRPQRLAQGEGHAFRERPP